LTIGGFPVDNKRYGRRRNKVVDNKRYGRRRNKVRILLKFMLNMLVFSQLPLLQTKIDKKYELV
jgi:hypothetical protein